MRSLFKKLLGNVSAPTPPHPNDIILTGVPRSGTTLTCHLLNQIPDVVALHEPLQPTDFHAMRNHEVRCDAISAFYAQTRQSLLENGVAFSKNVAGQVPDNPVGGQRNQKGLRVSRVERSEIKIDKPLTPDFVLGMKHPAFFTALLEPLLKRYRAFAVVRNPLGTLSSWSSVNMPVHEGHTYAAEGVAPDLKNGLAQIEDRIERQLFLLDWLFNQYAQFLPPENVIRYEDIIQSGGKALQVIVPGAAQLDEPLASRNKNAEYNADERKQLGERLLRSEGAYWKFYTRESVKDLLR